MFKRVLIANRGEIACRITRTLHALGVEAVAVYSDADAQALHVREADVAVRLGPGPVAESYLLVDKVIAAARETGAEAVHPGYGFLSENADFAEAVEAAGLVFLGPTPEQLRSFGRKHTARALAEAAGVPLAPGSALITDPDVATREAERIGYPLLIKSTAGGGGIGMTVCRQPAELEEALAASRRLASTHFGEAGVFLERFVESARHIEVQIFGDGAGGVYTLGTRDCSVQRRNQKVIEETPAPNLSEETQNALQECACALAAAAKYRSAGTVEFLVDALTGAFYFLEVNTRLQVEHGVTEEVFGVDLVAWMVKLGAGEFARSTDIRSVPQMTGSTAPATEAWNGFPRHASHGDSAVLSANGHAIECRLYAEDPHRNYQPSTGTLTHLVWPEGVRIDTGVERGDEISPFYDPMVAKLIVYAEDRPAAVAKLNQALEATEVAGIVTNLGLLREITDQPVFLNGEVTTGFLTEWSYHPRTVEVIAGGTQTTIQDWPGRVGYWAVGVPPSGPMDDYNFRLANRLLNNPEGTAALECTAGGPSLTFHVDSFLCLTGARMPAHLGDRVVPYYETVPVKAGETLVMDRIESAGQRTYLAVAGGFSVPDYLGSKSTFMLGQFGGHAGRALRTGDVLQLGELAEPVLPTTLPEAARPALTQQWQIGVIYGPHAAPDFFTEDDIDMVFATEWEVHYNSARTGVRLIGPAPTWARTDGGEAGLHPSNIHDNAYAIGTIDFTGDMPVILGPDGPSLGGFVCPATLPRAERWKMGQLRPGDTVRFALMTHDDALAAEAAQVESIASLTASEIETAPAPRPVQAPLRIDPDLNPVVTYRPSGDDYLLVEYGPLELDLTLRFRAHELMTWLTEQRVPGILDLTPGIRSLQVHYNPGVVPQDRLLQVLTEAEREMPAIDELEVPTRIVHLPLSWDDPATRLAIEKYTQSVRPDAPWCPSNIEFIRRMNGLADEAEVKRIFFDASYLVMGLGDVYLGAPVATPVDPRHRLVTTKYNPARTWTPENAVGIGGAYLCIYGMEGPGGYQFVGRTVPVWNRYRTTDYFKEDKPWLLEFFDQLRFYEVSAEELLTLRSDFIHGRFAPKIEESTFKLRDYQAFLAENADSIGQFQRTQQAAFAEERARWEAAGQAMDHSELGEIEEPAAVEIPEGSRAIEAHVSGCVWKLCVEVGERVEEGQPLLILESMKMEFAIDADRASVVTALYCTEGTPVQAGQPLLAMQPG